MEDALLTHALSALYTSARQCPSSSS